MDSARSLPLPSVVRRPGLDRLRVWATLLVVVLHAGVPYTVAPLPGLVWPIGHATVSPLVDVLFWGVEGAIMPVFFLLSGYGAAQSLASRPGSFLATRWRRLGRPLLAAAVCLLPVELYIWLTGWALDGRIPWKKLQSLKLGPHHEQLWGLSHLWYLEYLLILSAMLWVGTRTGPGLRSLASRIPHDPRLWGAAVFLTLWAAPEVVVGFQHSFLPVPAKFVYSGLFFLAGASEFRQPAIGPLSRRLAVACGAALLCGVLPWIHRQAASPLTGMDRLWLAAGLTAYAVFVTQAAWSLAWNSQAPTSPTVDRLARASFWIYLVHHPLVAVGHIVLRDTVWPAEVRFALVLAGTLVISMASHEFLVRGSWLGQLLDGKADAPRQPSQPAVAPAIRRAA